MPNSNHAKSQENIRELNKITISCTNLPISANLAHMRVGDNPCRLVWVHPPKMLPKIFLVVGPMVGNISIRLIIGCIYIYIWIRYVIGSYRIPINILQIRKGKSSSPSYIQLLYLFSCFRAHGMPWLSHPGCPAGGLWWPHETWTTWFPSWLHLPRLLSRSCITSQGSFICFENMMSPVLSLAKGKNCGHNAECKQRNPGAVSTYRLT